MAEKTDDQGGTLENTTISCIVGGETKEERVMFNTPDILEKVRGYPDGATVRISVQDTPEGEPRVLLEKSKDEAVAELEASVMSKDIIDREFRKFARMVFCHSRMRAVGVHAIVDNDNSEYGGFGFVITSPRCTTEHAVAFVNSGDANMDEFVTKANLSVPTRKQTNGEKQIVIPTQDQIEELG